MQVTVKKVAYENIILTAPLTPNINHRQTVFGGSASAIALLAGWSLLHVRLTQNNIKARIVIQRNIMHYEKPMADTFTATTRLHDEKAWAKFIHILKKKNRAKISLMVDLHCKTEHAGKLGGEFVAILMDGMEISHSTTL